MKITVQEVERYLSDVKAAVRKGWYQIERNQRRPDNLQLFLDYVLDEAKVKEILLSLTAMDFSGIICIQVINQSSRRK